MKRRYQYGPTGEVLFDQVFDATVTTPSQSEVDLLLPLGDHQHSTRVVLAHDFQDATYVRQSLDYAQFGRVTATLGANGLAETSGAVTVIGHHGSVADAATGLQLKGERWYSPDLGRFVSEDPIQDGTNWYAFAGNDPVNYADPSGLYQQGHPLKGGSSKLDGFLRGSVNQALNPVRTPSTPFGGFVDADRGRQIFGLGPIPKTAAPLPTPVQQFNRSLSQSSNLSTLTRTVDPLQSFVSQTQETRAYWHQVELDRNAVVKKEAFGGGWAGAEALAMGKQYERDALRSPTLGGYFSNKAASLGLNASGFIANAVLGYTTPGQHVTYGDGRTAMRLGGPDTASLASQATFFGPMILSGASRAAQPGRGFVLGETSELTYPLGTADEQIAAFRAQQRINRGQLLEAPGGNARSMTPYRDPARPGYNNGATHMDHVQARSLDGPDEAFNLRPEAAETNMRKGGYEGQLKAAEQYYRRHGMTKAQARSVIQPEIDALRNSVVPRPMDPRVLDRLPANPLDQAYPRR